MEMYYSIDDDVVVKVCLDGIGGIDDGCKRILSVIGKISEIHIIGHDDTIYKVLIIDSNRGRNLMIDIPEKDIVAKIF